MIRKYISLLVEKWSGSEKGDRFRLGFIIFMQVAFIGAFLIALYEREWLTLFVAVVALAIVWTPAILARNLRIHLPLEFELLLNIFIYASIFLGEMRGYYTRFWWWDFVLHTSSGLALGFLGFLFLFALYRGGRLKMSPSLMALFSFCFALSLGALWEIFEFAMDGAFGFNMQKNGLHDTMWDLIADTIGASVAALSGYFYMKYKWRGTGIFEGYLNAYFAKNSEGAAESLVAKE